MAEVAAFTPAVSAAPAPSVSGSTAPAATVTPAATPVPTQTTSTGGTLLDALKPQEPAKADAAKADPAKADPAKPAEVAKADYSKLEMPKDSLLPATHKEKIAAFASKHSLSPEVAQEVLKSQSADLKEYVDSQVKAYDGLKQTWVDALKAHPKFGGDKLAEYNKGATEVLNKYGSPELMKMLQESGYAYKVEVAELLSNISNAMKPDKMVAPGAGAGAGGKDMSMDAIAKRMFNKSNHV